MQRRQDISELGVGIGVTSGGGSSDWVPGLEAPIRAGCRDRGRVWGRRSGDGKDPSWAVLLVRRRALGAGSMAVVAVLGGAASGAGRGFVAAAVGAWGVGLGERSPGPDAEDRTGKTGG